MRMTLEQVQAERLQMDAKARANERVAELERTVDTLVKLVERMGCDLNTHWWGDNMPDWPYTPAGQREYDAARHEDDGPDPTRESEGAWGYE